MNQELNDAQGVISGTLRVGVSINYAMYRLPPLLRHYQERALHMVGQHGSLTDAERLGHPARYQGER